MNRFFIVFSRELRETLRSKPFIIISAIMALCLAAIALLPLFGASDGEKNEPVSGADNIYIHNCAVSENSDRETVEKLAEALPYISFSAAVTDDTSQYEALLEKYDAILVVRSAGDYDCYEKLSLGAQSIKYLFDDALTSICRTDSLVQLGVSYADAQSVLSANISGRSFFVGENLFGKMICNYVLVMLMFISIALYGQMVATRVASEKGSRTMELLATSASVRELLYGKVLGVGAAGLIQISVFIVSAVFLLNISSGSGISTIAALAANITAADIVFACAYFILGFLLMAFLFGGLGAMVDQLEDLSGIANIPVYIFMAGYLIAVFSTGSGSVSPLMVFASYFPFWSPVTMFSRMSAENVANWEVIVSLAILLASCLLAARVSVKLYASGMLRYGKAPGIKAILKSINQKKGN
ncbi:MAG: ABC transporter permease [Clostridia bacterium]|nr:ABC transporter permease [Clostridia bacterium]